VKKVNSQDAVTGEILPYALVAVKQKIPNGFMEGWVAMGLGSPMRALAGLRKELGADGYAVLFALLERLNFENAIHVVQKEIAEELGMLQPNVSRSIKKLLELGVLLEGPKFGRNRTYKLNPAYGWRGSAKSHQKALRAQEKASLAGLKIHKGGKAD